MLTSRIHVHHPFVRQFVVGWVTVLDSVPHLDLLSHAPEFLPGLFEVLGDTHAEVRNQAEAALGDLLRGIIKREQDARSLRAPLSTDDRISGKFRHHQPPSIYRLEKCSIINTNMVINQSIIIMIISCSTYSHLPLILRRSLQSIRPAVLRKKMLLLLHLLLVE